MPFEVTSGNDKTIKISTLKTTITTLTQATKTTKKLADLKKDNNALAAWANFINAFNNFNNLHFTQASEEDSIRLPMREKASVAASAFFEKLQKILNKDLPKDIKKLTKQINNAKTTQVMRTDGAVHTSCQNFNNELTRYRKIEPEYNRLKKSLALYHRNQTLDIPDTSNLQSLFTAKALALKTKEEADAAKGPCCCGLFGRPKKINGADERDPLLVNDDKEGKNPFRV